MKSFDKYYYYHTSVQSPKIDVKFFNKAYKDIRNQEAKVLREDFCGTFSISCEWVKLSPNKKAIGIDLDLEPIEYGKTNYLSALNPEQQEKVLVLNKDVMIGSNPQADIVSASNFSYYIFKKRDKLREYFKAAYKGLKENGIFIVDCFGGTATTEPVEEETEHDEGFSYFWDQDSFDPVSNFAQFYIHFQRNGETKREKVFSYDWRMWSIPEIRETMLEAGFKDTAVMWEGTDKNGDGNGKFIRVTQGEHCESWIAYIIGIN